MPNLRINTQRTYSPTQATRLLREAGIIEPTGVRGRYRYQNRSYRRPDILRELATEVRPSRFTINNELLGTGRILDPLGRVQSQPLDWEHPVQAEVEFSELVRAFAPESEPAPEPLRNLNRRGYHHGARNVASALERLSADPDGVKRSFGLEWEIYSLTNEQESKLCYLLDTLPPHETERDGSLTNTGVEIIFEPMSATQYKETFLTLKRFVEENNINMENTGAHTTYGVSNSRIIDRKDLQIRLNRYALAVKAVGTQQNIKGVFGRDFSSYCQLPQNTLTNQHSNAFSNNSRDHTCWEMRLMNWKADIDKIIELFRITESVFYRPTNGNDFIKVFNLLGSNTDGE